MATMLHRLVHLWKQLVILGLLITIIGSFAIYIYAQRQYTLLRNLEWQEHAERMETLREDLHPIFASSDVLSSLSQDDQEHIHDLLSPIFEGIPNLFRVSLIDQNGTLLFGQERSAVTVFQLRSAGASSSDAPAEKHSSLYTLFEDPPHVIQLPLIGQHSQVGYLRGEFFSNESGATLIQVAKVTLQITFTAIGVMIVVGIVSILTQIQNRLSVKQQQLEEYVVSLEKTNEHLQRAKKELQVSEKLASLGYLAAGIAHEIGNPLAAVMGYIEVLQKTSFDREKTRDVLARTMKELERMRRILREIVDFSRPHVINRHIVDVNTIVQKMAAHLPAAPNKTIAFQLDITEFPLLAEVDEHKLLSVFQNILGNAMDAIPDAGEIRVSTSRRIRETRTMPGGSEVIAIQFSDTGVGIPEEQLQRVFEPFFTTKDPGKGMGLGLTLCHRIIESLNGEIEIHSTCGVGTEVTIFLPPVRKIAAHA
jgi:signal transduction histidine kinase